MSRLVKDPSKVGPGSYDITELVTQKKTSRGVLNWHNSVCARGGGIRPSYSTQIDVGPGSYDGSEKFYKPS